MKKIISLTLITIMILAATVLPIFAAETDEFTREEAEQLFKDAHTCYMALQWNTNADVLKNIEVKISDKYEIEKFVINGREFVIDTLSDIKELAETYYTSEYTDVLTKGTIFHKGEDLFYENADGKVQANSDFWDENKIYFHDDYGTPLEFGELTVNGNKAILEINAKVKNGGTVKVHSYYIKVPVEFTKTASGWRLSDETMISIFTHKTSFMPYVYKHTLYDTEERTYTEVPLNPNTGDTTVTTAALLATIALAAVITPFALSKKRRVR